MPAETTTSEPTRSNSLTADDVLAAIKTLDQASGADSNHFRWRLRQWVRTQDQLAESRSRRQIAMLSLPAHRGTCDCQPCNEAYGSRKQVAVPELGQD